MHAIADQVTAQVAATAETAAAATQHASLQMQSRRSTRVARAASVNAGFSNTSTSNASSASSDSNDSNDSSKGANGMLARTKDLDQNNKSAPSPFVITSDVVMPDATIPALMAMTTEATCAAMTQAAAASAASSGAVAASTNGTNAANAANAANNANFLFQRPESAFKLTASALPLLSSSQSQSPTASSLGFSPLLGSQELEGLDWSGSPKLGDEIFPFHSSANNASRINAASDSLSMGKPIDNSNNLHANASSSSTANNNNNNNNNGVKTQMEVHSSFAGNSGVKFVTDVNNNNNNNNINNNNTATRNVLPPAASAPHSILTSAMVQAAAAQQQFAMDLSAPVRMGGNTNIQNGGNMTNSSSIVHDTCSSSSTSTSTGAVYQNALHRVSYSSASSATSSAPNGSPASARNAVSAFYDDSLVGGNLGRSNATSSHTLMLLDNQQPMRLTQQHQQPQLHQRFSQNHHQQQQQLMDLEREAAEPWLEQLHQQTAFGEITSQSGSRPGTAQLTEQAQQLQQILSSMSTRAALAGSTLSVAAGQHPQQQATESGSRRRTLSTASVDQPCSRRVQFTMGSPLRLISMPGVHIALEKEELWRTFFRHGNEMILTKKGRRLFPTPSFTITGLPEHRSFSIVINFVPASKVAHRYVGEAWAEVPTSKSLDCNVVTQFVHNSSPALGSVWVEHPFMFDFKITNNEITSTTSDAVLLHALHKYIFCVQVFEPLAEDESSMLEVDLEAPAGANRMHLPGHRLVHSQLFEETQFIAVTAYCNPNIRALKISHNPFARAFTDRARGDIETARALTQALENQDDSSAGEASPIPVAMVGPQRAPVRRSSFGGADMLSPATTDDGTPLRPQFLPLCFEPERSRSAALSSAPTPPTPIPTRITARRNRTVSEMDAVDSTASLSPAHSLASRNHTPSPMIQQGSTAFPFTTLPSASPKRARLDHSQGLRSITSLGGGARKLSFESMYSSDFSDLLLDAQRMFSNANARNSGHGGLTTSASCSSMASTNSRSAGLPHLSHTYFPGSSADSTPLPTPGLGHSGTQGTQPTARPRVMSISQNRANWDAFQHATQSANLDSANTSTVEELEGLIGAVARSAKEAAIEMMTKMHATSPQFRSSEEYAHQVKLAMNDAKIQIVVCDLAVFTPTTLQRLRANPVSADLSLMVVVPPNTLPSLIDSILASGVEDVLYEPLPPALLKQHLVRCIERRSWHAYM